MKTDPVQHLTGWDPFILQWKLIEEFPFVEILVSELLCGQPKNHIAIRAYDVLAVFAGSANVFQISATSYGLHDRKHQHHCFGANPLPSSIHWATIRTGINIAISSPFLQYRSVWSPRRNPITLISHSYSSAYHFFILSLQTQIYLILIPLIPSGTYCLFAYGIIAYSGALVYRCQG